MQRKYSRLVVDGAKQTPSRAMLRAVGFQDADFEKPQIGVASTWANLTPCNMHINELASEAIAGADEAGGKGVLFNTITVSDGISMGSPGMRYSLVSREVIADSIETVVGAEGFDGFVAIGGCDKNIPGCAMAIARLNRPAVFVYGGTIKPGAKRRDIVAVFEAVGGHAAGRVSDAELLEVERTAIPGPGSCGGMYTANTMASAIEALGLSLPNSSAQEAVGAAKRDDCRRAGAAVVALVQGRYQAERHPHEEGVRERDHRHDRARWQHERGAAPAGDRARGQGQTRTTGLHADRQTRPAARRRASERPLSNVGAHRHWRNPAPDEKVVRRETAAR